MTNYQCKKARLIESLKQTNGRVRLRKSTSNLFRNRTSSPASLDVREMNQVINVDTTQQTVEVEGMTTYLDLVDACLQHNCMPLVVPQLKSITIGGAVSGIGIESSSFRHGLPHESVLNMEVLLSNGEVENCSPNGKNRDLFYGIPNSYGTLGYVLKLTCKTMPVKPYVALTHTRYHSPEKYFEAVNAACASDVDFIDGCIFNENELYLSLGKFTNEAPYTSDYTWLNIYFRSVQSRSTDYLSIQDYIWRWDTDWFWCSKNVFAQNLPIRLLLGRKRLNSITYQKIMRWNVRYGITAKINALLSRQPESVIQDVDIPIANAAEFLKFFIKEVGIKPIWICPIGGHDPQRVFPSYPLNSKGIYINFGFWDVVQNPEKKPTGYFNRLIEDKVSQLGGIKSLYSDVYFSQKQFMDMYNGTAYDALKTKYDPEQKFKSLYQKCVLKN